MSEQSDAIRHIKSILNFPETRRGITPDFEADTDRLIADAQNLRSGPLLDQKLTEAQVAATAWTAAELTRIGDLMQEALDVMKEWNR